MYDFEETLLVNALGKLGASARRAFGAAAATRQLGNYEYFARRFDTGNEHRPRAIADRLWANLSADDIDSDMWSAALDDVMDMLPEECEFKTIEYPLAEDAISSLAYAIRCLLSNEAQEAAWAGGRAYEAADQAAIRALDVQPGLPETEAAIKAHPFVQ